MLPGLPSAALARFMLQYARVRDWTQIVGV